MQMTSVENAVHITDVKFTLQIYIAPLSIVDFLVLSEVVGQVDGQLKPCAGTVYPGDLSSDLHVEHTFYGHRSMGPPAARREWRAECDPQAHARYRTGERQSPHVTKVLRLQTPSPMTGTTHLPQTRKTAREYGTTRAYCITFSSRHTLKSARWPVYM